MRDSPTRMAIPKIENMVQQPADSQLRPIRYELSDPEGPRPQGVC